MPANVPLALHVIHAGLLLAGGLCLLVLAVRLVRSGGWRNPLAGVPLPVNGPSLAAAAALPLVFLITYWTVAGMLVGDRGPQGRLEPGTDAWHRVTLADGLAKAVAAVLMGVLLARVRATTRQRGPHLAWRRGLMASVGALLVLLPITELQWRMGCVVWGWFRPEPPPLHGVLLALDRTEWGVWGTVQLVAGAIVMAPLAEELFFRGVLLQAMCYHLRRGWPAIVVSSVAFGLLHEQPQDVLPLVSMGVVLGYLRLRCGALWPCVLTHVLFNGRTIACALLWPETIRGM